MRLRGFLFGLAGGVIGTVLVLVVLFALGFTDIEKKTVIERVETSTPLVYNSPGTTAGLTPEQIYQRSASGVVMVISTFPSSGFGSPFGGGDTQGLGSGFVVSKDGYILTNAHVVQDQDTKAKDIEVVFKGSGSQTTRVPGTLVGVDVSSDVALVKVDPSKVKLNPLPLGDSDKVLVGEPVVAIGNPLGYDFSLSAGVVSAVGRTLQAPNKATIYNGIQTDAAINQGNSGGPLIDASGRVIGINEQIASPSGAGNVGLGFAVPVNLAVHSMEQLQKYGEVRYAWLGIEGETITPDIAHTFGLPVDTGVLLAQAFSGGPAEKAGLKGGSRDVTVQGQDFVLGGDIITAIDGQAVTGMQDLITIIDKHQPGDKVKLAVISGGQKKQVEVTLGQRPASM